MHLFFHSHKWFASLTPQKISNQQISPLSSFNHNSLEKFSMQFHYNQFFFIDQFKINYVQLTLSNKILYWLQSTKKKLRTYNESKCETHGYNTIQSVWLVDWLSNEILRNLNPILSISYIFVTQLFISSTLKIPKETSAKRELMIKLT